MLDPFLLLDRFSSDKPQDDIAGFPPHPHRGFETVTYLLHGRMRHKDSAGHEGARFLLVAGRPLREPVARGGPLVMNTQDEIRQAFADYKNGTLA